MFDKQKILAVSPTEEPALSPTLLELYKRPRRDFPGRSQKFTCVPAVTYFQRRGCRDYGEAVVGDVVEQTLLLKP